MTCLLRLLCLAALGLFTFTPPVASEVLIAPTRVVLEKGERSTEIIVVNKGTGTAAFRVSLENRRMLVNGSMQAADTALEGERFAKDLIRYAPRRMLLEPGARQTIRISTQLSSDLAPGEYRSHLRLMAAPLSAGRTLESATSEQNDSLSIQLVAIRSLTIPVILRVGDLDAAVSIDSIAMNEATASEDAMLITHMQRTGSRSTYGDIRIYNNDAPEPVYFARGIAIYTPNTERDVILPLPEDVRAKLTGRNVRVEYVSSDPENPGLIAAHQTFIP